MSLPSKELSESALDALIARERTRVVAPLTEWRALSAQLRDEGLIHGPAHAAPEPTFTPSYTAPPRPRSSVFRWSARLVTSAALLGIGVLVGRGMTFGQELIPQLVNAVQASGDSITISTSRDIASPAQARRILARSQTEWRQAAAYLAERDSAFSLALPAADAPAAARTRLMALDHMVEAAQSAAQMAPADPVVNQYYLSAYSARQRTVRTLKRTLPDGVQLTGF
jgi:hypothetical protein